MKPDKFTRILTYFYIIPFAVMIFFNTANSLLRTTYFELYQVVEAARYQWDKPIIVTVFSIIVLLLLYISWKKNLLGHIDLNNLSVIFTGLFSLCIILLFRCEATCDSSLISDIAIEFSQNNYSAFEQGGYLYSYPFQIGFAALLELIYRIFGIENFIVFQLLNIASIMVILDMLNRITGEIFESKDIQDLESILSFGMLPLFLFSTFVYGDIIGWAFGVSAIYYIIKYIKDNHWKPIFITGVLFMFGTLIKSNINILLVASVIAILLDSVHKKNYKQLLWIIVLFIFSQVGVRWVNQIYVNRANLEAYPSGIPKIAWIAMSMQEADEGGYACGWYNAYNWNVYMENGYNADLTTEACIQSLKESFDKFLHEQKYTLNFFYKKFTSQWNAPTFQSMITNEWASRHVDNLSPVAIFFLYGPGRDVLYSVMNVYHFIIFLCGSIYFLFDRNKWTFLKAYYILNIFGGFLFHMLWEAQSRYILGYFVLMLPLAACGCHYLLLFIKNKLKILK